MGFTPLERSKALLPCFPHLRRSALFGPSCHLGSVFVIGWVLGALFLFFLGTGSCSLRFFGGEFGNLHPQLVASPVCSRGIPVTDLASPSLAVSCIAFFFCTFFCTFFFLGVFFVFFLAAASSPLLSSSSSESSSSSALDNDFHCCHCHYHCSSSLFCFRIMWWRVLPMRSAAVCTERESVESQGTIKVSARTLSTRRTANS